MMRRRQRGAALIILLAILALGASWFVVKRIAAMQGDFVAANRETNAIVLNKAKQALVGYVAAQAAKQGEDNPGAFPCPEAPASFNSITGTDGKSAASCTLPAVGRFPWRTIGTDKLVDSSGEPLWYVISTGWAYNGSNTNINSNSVGQLVVDGAAGTDSDTVVALLIAPGPPTTVSASASCTPWTQSRPTVAPPDVRNYLECENATSPADATFATAGPSGSFNDQVLRITKGDVMPGIEAAIADRMQREIAVALKSVYAAPGWGLAAGKNIYPFAAPFADPSTSAMRGQGAGPATYQGLLPFNNAETSPGSGVLCTAGASAPHCSPSFVGWSSASLSGANVYSPNCTTTPTQINCTYYYRCPLLCGVLGTPSPSTYPITINATATNVGMALRQLNTATPMTNVNTAGRSASGVLNSSGSAAITLNGTTTVSNDSGGLLGLVSNLLCGLGLGTIGCTQANIAVPITLLADHALLDKTDPTFGWFVRNKWHELTYYVVTPNYTPSVLPGMPPAPCSGGCITVSNVSPAGGQRALLILAGRSINGSARPSATLGDYLEFGNATGSFERQTVSTVNQPALKRAFNDRIVVVDSD